MFQRLYKHNNLISSKNDKRENFERNRKIRRSQAFDFWRGPEATTETQIIRSKPLKDIQNILREKTRYKVLKKKTIKKKQPPPFVVGVVRHKIYSPPFLHTSQKVNKSTKKKNFPTPQQPLKSFAPKNYKFKPPKGLKVNNFTPCKCSPFTLGSTFGRHQEKNVNTKEVKFENVTMRSHMKKLSNNCLSTNSITPKIKEDIKIDKYESVKRQLWSNESNEVPIFGRLNVARALRKSIDKLPTDNENEENKTNPSKTFENKEMSSINTKLSENIHNENKSLDSSKFCNKNKYVFSRTSRISSPNLSRISFTPINNLKQNTQIEDTCKTTENDVKYNSPCVSPILSQNFQWNTLHSPQYGKLQLTRTMSNVEDSSSSKSTILYKTIIENNISSSCLQLEESNNSLTKESIAVIKDIVVEKENKNLIALDSATQNSSNITSVSSNDLSNQETKSSLEIIEKKSLTNVSNENRFSYEKKDQNVKNQEYLRTSKSCTLNCFAIINKDSSEDVNKPETILYSKKTEENTRKNQDDKKEFDLKGITQDSLYNNDSINLLSEQETDFCLETIEDKNLVEDIANSLSCIKPTDKKDVSNTLQSEKNISNQKHLNASTSFSLNSSAIVHLSPESLNKLKISLHSKKTKDINRDEKNINHYSSNTSIKTLIISPANEKSAITAGQLEKDNFARKNEDYTEMDDLNRITQDSPNHDYSLNHLFEQEPEFCSKGVADKNADDGIVTNSLSCVTPTNEKDVRVTPQAQKDISISKDQKDKNEPQLHTSTNVELNSYTILNDSSKNVNVSKTSLYSKEIGNNSEDEKCIINSLPQTSVLSSTNTKSSIITEQLEKDNAARKNKDYTEIDDLKRIIKDSPSHDYSLNHLFEQEPEFCSEGIEDENAVHGIAANTLSRVTPTNKKDVKVTPQAQKDTSINKDQDDKIEAQLHISTNFEINSYTSLNDLSENINKPETSSYSKKIEDIPSVNEKNTTFIAISEDTENNSSCTTSIISRSYKECTAVSLQTKSNNSIKNDTICEDRSDAVPDSLSRNSKQKYNLHLNNFENITNSEDTVNNSDPISSIKILINDSDITSSQLKEIIFQEKNDQNLSRDLSFSTSNVNSKNNLSNNSNKMLEKVNLDECDDEEIVTKILNPSSSTPIKRHECIINIFSPATTEKMTAVKKISSFESMYTNKEDLQVIDLIDSPEVDKKPIIADYISENKIEVDENSIIDLVSDDEEDHVLFLSKVIAAHAAINAVSPTSISKKAAIATVKNIPKIQVSPQKTPRSYLISKETSPIATDVGSPARVLSLRNRVVNATPSPKRTPKKTRLSPKKNIRSQIILKENSPLPSQVASPTRVLSLRNRVVDLTPSPKKTTKNSRVLPQKTPQIQSALKENSPIKNTLASPVRVLTLRNRVVDVTPSPTKLTPRRRKKENVQK